MTITYMNRTAVQQAISVLYLGSAGSLNPHVINGSITGGSTYGRPIVAAVPFSVNGPPSAASELAGANSTLVTLTNVDFNPATSFGQGYSINNDVIVSNAITNFSDPIFPFTETIMPTSSGTANQTMYQPSYVVGHEFERIVPPMPILDHDGNERTLAIFDFTLWTALDAGNVGLYDITTHALEREKKWEGYDPAIIGYGQNVAARPNETGTGNYLLFSGVYIGTGTRPLLIQADLSGMESGRFNLFLSDPTWDAVLAQPVATHSVHALWPCNAGWFGVFGINTVTTPSFIVFNPDCSKYWIYVIVALDEETRSAIFTVGWGNNGSERIFIDRAIAGNGKGGEFTINGADGNEALIMTNIQRTSPMPPFPPVLSLPCVPCAPTDYINDGTWRLGG